MKRKNKIIIIVIFVKIDYKKIKKKITHYI